MSLFQQLFGRFFKRDTLVHITQTQREAIIDAFTFAILADGELAPEEHEHFNLALADMDWTGAQSREAYTATAFARVEEVTASPESARAYCKEIGERLATEELREEAYAIASRLVCADGEVVDSERGLMSLFIQEFPVDPMRAVELSRKAHREFKIL